MKLHNYELENFIIFLLEMELAGKQSRMRSKLIKLLNDRYEEFRNDSIRLFEEFAEKDDEGNPKPTDDGTGYKVVDTSAFEDEYDLLAREIVVIEISEERTEMFEIVRNCVLNTTKVFKGKEATLYNRYCDILENQ